MLITKPLNDNMNIIPQDTLDTLIRQHQSEDDTHVEDFFRIKDYLVIVTHTRSSKPYYSAYLYDDEFIHLTVVLDNGFSRHHIDVSLRELSHAPPNWVTQLGHVNLMAGEFCLLTQKGTR